MSDDPKWRSFPVLRRLYGQWRVLRAHRANPATVPFSRDWEKLLADAGIDSAEARAEADRDARKLAGAGLITLKSLPSRPRLIDRVIVPFASEPRLRALFGDPDTTLKRTTLRSVLAAFQARPHPRLPSRWPAWCEELLVRHDAGRSLRPLDGTNPETLQGDLELLYRLTIPEWPPHTPIRTASVELGLNSKALEQAQTRVETALATLLGEGSSLESLGIVVSTPWLLVNGPLRLNFHDGTAVDLAPFWGLTGVSELDLDRAKDLITTAGRVLMVENTKTTLRQLASANGDRSTLLVGAPGATTPVRLFLQKLNHGPALFHFGDTDPDGYQILGQLRKENALPITPFLMEYRPEQDSAPLDPRQQQLVQRLLKSPVLADCHAELGKMLVANQLGNFEQETYGPPTLHVWPFF